ncbi:MAG: DNA alkylation repair protein [Polyangiales bacterium]
MSYETTLISRLAKAYGAAADPERAVAMKAYMRDQFEFYGIMRTSRDAIHREALLGLPKPTEADLAGFARSCWKKPQREWQYVAMGLLRKHVRTLSAEFLPVAKELIATKSWWDTVDELATHVVGGLVTRYPALVVEMDAWAKSGDLWIVRSAILHQNRYRDKTDAERLFTYCAANATHKDFFMRKAIGWALRVYAATDPRAVERFVKKTPTLSPLSVKEAMRGVARAS